MAAETSKRASKGRTTGKKSGKKKAPRGKMPPTRQQLEKSRQKAEARAEKKEKKERGKRRAPTQQSNYQHRPSPPVEPEIDSPEGHRCGYVALVGRPNVGKSTLLNKVLGQKIAATTHKPQTTRRNLLGVLSPKGAQLLLLDTPGHHRAKGPLNKFMVQQVRTALRDTDVVGYVVEARADRQITPGNARVIAEIKSSGRPVVVLVNKIDRVANKQALLPFLEKLSEEFGDQMRALVPVSAKRADGLPRAVEALALALPLGPAIYEDGQYTDATERSIVAELIREKVILETRDELPYAAAISVESFTDDRPKIVRIQATLHVERSSQKAIVIGKGGERLRAIGQRARLEIEAFVGSKVYLELHVRVTERWSERPREFADLGLTSGESA